MLVCILSRWRCNGCFRFSQGFMYAFGWYVCSMVSTINWDLVFFAQSRVNMLNKTWQINSVLKEEYSLILRKPGHRCQIKLIHSVGISWWSSKCDLIQNSICSALIITIGHWDFVVILHSFNWFHMRNTGYMWYVVSIFTWYANFELIGFP